MEIAVISGKGGTGKSSISAAFATIGDRVILADCDVDAANLYLLFNPENEDKETFISGHKAKIDYDSCTNCGICVSYCRFEGIIYKDDIVSINEINCDGCFLCSRICPFGAISMVSNDKSQMLSGSFRNGKMVYGRLAPGEENTGKLVSLVRTRAKKLSEENHLETIIIDGPPGTGCPVISTITGADKVVVVTEPTVSGLNDLMRVIEITKNFSNQTAVIINKHDLNPVLSDQIAEWCKSNDISIAGYLPFSDDMVKAMVEGKSIIEYAPRHPISDNLRKIWKTVMDQKE
jgi:MinD superfamily P-loop ATPase